jgi:hypothetical protein
MKKSVKFLITLAVVTFLCVLQLSPGLANISADESLVIQLILSKSSLLQQIYNPIYQDYSQSIAFAGKLQRLIV